MRKAYARLLAAQARGRQWHPLKQPLREMSGMMDLIAVQEILGVARTFAPVLQPLPPGDHRIEYLAPGYELRERPGT